MRQGDTHEPISEVELELKAGAPGALFDLALQLQEQVPLRVGNLSKAARGYALQAPVAAAAVKAGPVVLGPEMTVEEGFRVIVSNCLTQMQDNDAVGPTPSFTLSAILTSCQGGRRVGARKKADLRCGGAVPDPTSAPCSSGEPGHSPVHAGACAGEPGTV